MRWRIEWIHVGWDRYIELSCGNCGGIGQTWHIVQGETAAHLPMLQLIMVPNWIVEDRMLIFIAAKRSRASQQTPLLCF